MQTFLPYPDFAASAAALDTRRLGKQRVEALQVLRALTRVTYGWVGVPSAVIGVLGFFVIIAGFLGVNLGWFADGLHSYGSA